MCYANSFILHYRSIQSISLFAMATYYAFDYDILGAILFCKCDDVFPYSNLKYDKECICCPSDSIYGWTTIYFDWYKGHEDLQIKYLLMKITDKYFARHIFLLIFYNLL